MIQKAQAKGFTLGKIPKIIMINRLYGSDGYRRDQRAESEIEMNRQQFESGRDSAHIDLVLLKWG